MIRGRVTVDQKDDFEAKEVIIGLYGAEFVYFNKITPESNSVYQTKHIFLNASQSIHIFSDSVSRIGTTDYEFEFRTPDWLPASAVYASDYCNSSFKIRYEICAQVVPVK